MSEKFTFRPYTHSDLTGCCKLFNLAFKKEITEEYFLWKNKNLCNKGTSPIIYVAISETGDLAGTLSYLSYKIDYHDSESYIVQAADGIVSPLYQKRGVFSKLIAYSRQDLQQSGYKLIFGLPNSQAYPAWIKMGFNEFCLVKEFTKIIDCHYVFEKTITFPGSRTIATLINRANKKRNNVFENKYQIKCYDQSDKLPTEVETFLTAQKSPYRIIKDCAYVNWRYRSVPVEPGITYSLLTLTSDGFIRAIFVLKYSLKKHRAEIGDYFTPSSADLTSLVTSLVEYHQINRTDISTMNFKIFPNDNALEQSMMENRFVKKKEKRPIIMKSIGVEGNNDLEENIRLVFGDLDTF